MTTSGVPAGRDDGGRRLWPYSEDGAQPDEPANRYRFPLISNPYPRWRYVTAVVVSDELWIGQRPTDEELEIVASFHEEYCSRWYGPPHTGWRGRDLDKRPFDIDGGAVGRFLIKHANGGWGYRAHTWRYGPEFVPEWTDEPTGLVAVLDRYHAIRGNVAPPLGHVEGRSPGHLRNRVARLTVRPGRAGPNPLQGVMCPIDWSYSC